MFYDVLNVKHKLDIALGEDRMQAYWDDFKLFVNNRMSKREWDVRALDHLGPLNLGLHNEFIMAVFVGAQSALQPPPPAKKAKTHHQPRQQAGRAPAKASQKLSGWKVPFHEQLDRPDMAKRPRSERKGVVDLEYGAGFGNPATVALSAESPQLRARMYIAAVEAGLTNVCEDAADMLLQGMEYYTKAFIEQALVTSGTEHQLHDIVRHGFKRSPAEPSSEHEVEPLSVGQLALAATLRPHLLGAMPNTTKVKIANACQHQV